MADFRPFDSDARRRARDRAAGLIGDSILDALENAGFPLTDIDMVGALTPAAVPLIDAVIHAASARGVPP